MRRTINQHQIGNQYVMTLAIQRARSWRADVWAAKTYIGDIGGGDMLHIGIVDATEDDALFALCDALVAKNIDKIPAFTIQESEQS